MTSVAIYSHEDRFGAHRNKVSQPTPPLPHSHASHLINRANPLLAGIQADEAYQVGKGLTPVAAYLAQDDIIRIALEHGVDM